MNRLRDDEAADLVWIAFGMEPDTQGPGLIEVVVPDVTVDEAREQIEASLASFEAVDPATYEVHAGFDQGMPMARVVIKTRVD